MATPRDVLEPATLLQTSSESNWMLLLDSCTGSISGAPLLVIVEC